MGDVLQKGRGEKVGMGGKVGMRGKVGMGEWKGLS